MCARFLVLIGPTRTGTTSLFRYLSQDRRTFAASQVKETNFFATPAAAGAPQDARARYLRGFSDAGAGHIRLEASPLYFVGGGALVERMASVLANDDVRVIATLREPVARFVSLYRHSVTKRNVRGQEVAMADFVDVALEHRDRMQAVVGVDADLQAFNEGRYAELLEAWTGVLGRDRVRAIAFDALAEDAARQRVLGELYDWLNVADRSYLSTPYPQENRSRFVRWRGAHRIALGLNDAFEPVLNRLPGVRDVARRLYYAANETASSAPSVDATALARLREAYADANQGLGSRLNGLMLGPAPSWCSDA